MTAIRATGGGLELPRHLRGAGRTLLYLTIGVPYGIAYLVLVVAIQVLKPLLV